MTKHPKAGLPVKIANGPLKGKYFVVHDWYQNQYQGKDIKKVIERHFNEVKEVKRRGFPLDDKLVWGKIYPSMAWCCVHDDELLVQMTEVKNEDGTTTELPPNVAPMLSKGKGKARVKTVKKEKPDDGGTAS